jgi:transposase-like protein
MTESALTTAQLAERWGIRPETLRRWRMQNKGPSWFRTNGDSGHVRYPLAAIEGYEAGSRAIKKRSK